MQRATVAISPDVILEALGIEGVSVLEAKIDHWRTGSLVLLLTGDDLPECIEGGIPMALSLCDIQNINERRKLSEK